MRLLRLPSVLYVCACVGTAFSAAVRPADQTAALQQSIDSLPPDGVLDCGNQRYVVTSLQLKSNMTMRNCQLETASGATDLASPITIDGRTDAKTNIIIDNVHVRGNRHNQTNIGYIGQEDGGRHCFRLLGFVSNVVIDNSSGTYCATDGIALVSYGVSNSDDPADLPFQNITVRNSDFSFNRRQGGSADGIHNLVFDNVTFLQNGTTLPGGSEGDRCASTGESCYGTGFWYEDYRMEGPGEGLNGLSFFKCVFRGNYQRAILLLTAGRTEFSKYQPRTGIRIVNSYLDFGLQPTPEEYALQFLAKDALIGGIPVFQNVSIQNSFLDGSVGFRQTANVLIDSSQIQTRLPYLGYSTYSTDISFQNVDGSGKRLAASLDPSGRNTPQISYSAGHSNQSYAPALPESGQYAPGDIVWNTQPGASPLGWVCVAGGAPCSRWSSF